MRAKRILTVVAAVVLGVGLATSPAHAKCSKPCHHTIIVAFHSCKKACPKKKAGADCRLACVTTKKDAVTKCKAAMAPACSPSAAFID